MIIQKMDNFIKLPENIHYKIISYVFPKINSLKLINKKFLRYISIILKKGRIKNVDDVVNFYHIKFKKIINFIDKNPHYKFITLNYVNDCVDVCQLINHINFSDIILSISNSNIYIEKEIQTHKLYIHNCKMTNGIDNIKIKNTKHFICDRVYNSSTETLLLELTDVETFVYTNNYSSAGVHLKNNCLSLNMKITIKINENCNKFSIYNHQDKPIQIIFEETETALHLGERIGFIKQRLINFISL